MPDSPLVRDQSKSPIVLFSDDADFAETVRSAFDANGVVGFSCLEGGLGSGSTKIKDCNAAVVIVDLCTHENEANDLSELRQLMAQSGNIPVIVIVDAFSEIVARKLVQMRVADILVKPVAPVELLRACKTVTRTKSKESKISTFLPVAGGVGTTTLAIQSALTLLGGRTRSPTSTCLVDLNFFDGACADYLDIEARLNLNEIELKPERLDRQLLEGMLTRHSSGLAVIAAPNIPTESVAVAPNIVMGLLNVVCQCFDQIVIDMPKAWQVWTDNVVLGSDALFLVGEATVPGIRKAKQLVQSISTRLGQRPHPKVIVNHFEHRLFSPGLRRADLAASLGNAFAGTVPYNRKLVREAIDRGVPLDEIQKSSDVAAAIKRLIIPRMTKPNSLLQSLGRSPMLNWAARGHASVQNSPQA